MRGCSNSGKSTYIKKNYPGATICSADHYFMVNDEYRFNPRELPKAHQSCFKRFMENLRGLPGEQRTIVVDNTNLHAWEAAPYVLAADTYGYDVEIVSLDVDLANLLSRDNGHGVTEGVIRRMHKIFYEEKFPPFWPHKVIKG